MREQLMVEKLHHTLSFLSELKSIYVHCKMGFYETKIIDAILEYRSVSKRDALKIYYNNCQLIKDYNETGYKDYRLKNFERNSSKRDWLNDYYNLLVDRIPYVEEVYYNELMCLISFGKNNFPSISDYFSKYFNIRKIIVSGEVKDEDHLIEFICKCPRLHELEILETSLDQPFFSRLPIRSLKTLLVTNYKTTKNKKLIL
jgi:hypothetical protein